MTESFDLLSDAVGLQRGCLLALVGGGGKTSALLTLSRELADRGWRVVASTTTRVGSSIAASMPVLETTGKRLPDELVRAMSGPGRVFLCAGRGEDGKLIGTDPEMLDAIKVGGLADAIIVEADGARQMPLKAPGDHEPIIPETADIVFPFAGLDALGSAIEPGNVHRPEFLRRLTDSDRVTPEVIADVLCAGGGGLKGVPAGARVCPVLNKLDTVTPEEGLDTASAVLSRRPDRIPRVLLTSLQSGEFLRVQR